MMHAARGSQQRNKRFVSFFPFIIVLFYGPIFSIYSPTTSFGRGIPDFGLYEVALICWFFAFMIDVMNRNFGGGVRSFWYVNMCVFVLYVFLSIFWSYEGYTVNTIRGVIFSYLIPLIMAFAAKNYVQQENVFGKWTKHAAACCVFLSVMSIVQVVLNLQVDTITAMEVRGEGTLGNANLLAIFLVLNVPVFLYAMKEKILSRNVVFLVLMVVAVGMVSTISRKGILTMALTYMIFFLFTKNFKVLLLLLVLLVIGSIFAFQQKFVKERFNPQEISSQLEGRSKAIPVGLKLVAKSPLIGRGYEGFYHYSKGLFVAKKYQAHNNYVTALTNYGMIGFFLFMNIFAIPLYRSVRTLAMNTGSSSVRLRAIISISIILPFMLTAFFAGGLMYNSLITSLLYTYFAVFSFNDKERKYLSGEEPTAMFHR